MDQRQLNDKNAVNAAVTLWNNVFRPRLLCRLKSTITAVKFRPTICCPQWRSMLHTFQSNLKRWIFNRVLVSEACVFLLMAGWEVDCSLWKARRLTKWELLIKLRMTAFQYGSNMENIQNWRQTLTVSVSTCVCVFGLHDLRYVCVTGAAQRGEFQNKT